MHQQPIAVLKSKFEVDSDEDESNKFKKETAQGSDEED